MYGNITVHCCNDPYFTVGTVKVHFDFVMTDLKKKNRSRELIKFKS